MASTDKASKDRPIQPKTAGKADKASVRRPAKAAGAAPAAVEASLDEPRLIVEHGLARRVATIVEGPLGDVGFRLVRVKISSGEQRAVQIMAERADGTMSVDDCETASQAMSPALDLDDPIQGAYRLEVSSPGIDRPLTRVSDFKRAVGHEARVEMAVLIGNRKRFRGVIEGVDEIDGHPVATLRRTDVKPEAEDDEIAQLALEEMAEARLVLTDALIRDALRAAKALRRAAQDGSDERDADEAPAAPAPAERARTASKPVRGPGRFAAKNAAKKTGKTKGEA